MIKQSLRFEDCKKCSENNETACLWKRFSGILES